MTLLPRRFLAEALTAVGLIVAPSVLPALGFAPNTVNQILIWGLFGLGFDILFGYTGLLSFGQSAFYGTGGFVAAYLLTRMGLNDVLLGLVIGTIAATFVGYLVGLIALRRTGIYFTMITVAIAETFYFLEMSPLSAWTGGENGLPGVPTPRFELFGLSYQVGTGWSMYGFLAVCYFIGIVIALRIVRSPVGAILTAIRENPLRAAAVGHNVHGYKLAAFVIAAAYAGLAGGLLGVLQAFMPPEAFMFDTSGQLVMQTVIGGRGTLFGPLLGAAVWLSLRDFLQAALHLGAAWKLALGVIFVLLVRFLRRGIIGGFRDLGIYVKARTRPATAPIATSKRRRPLASVGSGHRREYPAFSGPVLEGARRHQVVRRHSRQQQHQFLGQRGRAAGDYRPQWRRQEHVLQDAHLRDAADLGPYRFPRARHYGARRRQGVSARPDQELSGQSALQSPHLAREHRHRGVGRTARHLSLDLLRSLERVPGLDTQVESTLALIGLSDRADLPVAELAYGEKRRLEIGLALASSPSLLLLDEPLAGMSPQERAETVQLLKNIRRGRTMIIVEHDMDAVFELAERITVLHEGTLLAEGTPAEIQRNRSVQEAYLGGVAA